MTIITVFTAVPVSAGAQSTLSPHYPAAGRQMRLPAPAGPILSAHHGRTAPPLAASAATEDTSWDNLFQDYGNDSGAWSGGDGAQSLLLPDGKTMWFFGDTYLGNVNRDYTRPPLNTGIAHNSAVLQSGSTLGPTFAAPRGSKGYDFQADYSWVSPPSGYSSSRYELINGDQVMDNGVVYKFMQLADRNYHPGGFQYKLVGTVLQPFTYDSSTGALTPGSGSAFGVDDTSTSDPVIWGAALLVSGGYIYIYGVQPYNSVSLYLARAPVGQLANGFAWQFYDTKPGCSPGASAWTSQALSATPLMTGVSEGFSVTDVDGTYVLLSNDNAGASPNDAVARYASCPTGFSASSTAYTVYQPSDPYGYLTYEYRIVPQFSNGSNVLVSYSTDSTRVDESCLYENYYNATIYRPRFLDIQLPGISGASGPVTQVSAPSPPAGTTPPVPPSQETFHPQNSGDNWAAANCQASTSPSSAPQVSVTGNTNNDVTLSWSMSPRAMWLYTVVYCDTNMLSCGDNTAVNLIPGCNGYPNVACGQLLVWGSTALHALYWKAGDTYQIRVETAKAVFTPGFSWSNIVTAVPTAPAGLEGCKFGTISIYYKNNTSAAYQSNADAAANAWTDTPTQISLSPVNGGATNNININTIYMNSSDDGITYFPACGSNLIWSGVVNSDYNTYWTDRSQYDFHGREQVMVHELGHALGLAHSGTSDCNGQPIMYPSSDRYFVCGHYLPQPGDIAAINYLYPPPSASSVRAAEPRVTGVPGGERGPSLAVDRAKEYRSIGELRAGSTAIVEATATGRSARVWVAGIPETVTTVAVTRVLWGSVHSQLIEIRQLGMEGVSSPQTTPVLAPGARYLLFLAPAYSQARRVLSGQYVITGDQGGYQLRSGAYRMISWNVPQLPSSLSPASAERAVTR